MALLLLARMTSCWAANPTYEENLKPGDFGWQPDSPTHFPAAFDEVGYIKGYASAASVNKGESLSFYVSVNAGADSRYSIRIYRLGYYAGKGGRLMLDYPASGYARGFRQSPCTMNPGPPLGDGMVQCNWAVSYVLTVPQSWTSGVYVAKLVLKTPVSDVPNYNYVVFTVRDDARIAAMRYQQPVATYQAYNKFGGSSLYGCYVTACTQGRPAYKESFDRPYAVDGASSLYALEEPFIFWLEQQGYDVAYGTDLDTQVDGRRLLQSKIVLMAGHSEYWSRQMYDAVESARDAGVNLMFLGGNTAYWQARFEPNPSSGVPNRVVVVYRTAQADPTLEPALKTINWRNLGRPEQSLLGLQWGNGKDYLSRQDGLPWVVRNANQWAYAGTGLSEGEAIPGIIGQEWDSVYPDAYGTVPDYVGRTGTLPPGRTAVDPPSLSFDVIEHSDLLASQVQYSPPRYDLPLTTDAVIYQSLSGAYVFSAGSVLWGRLMRASTPLQIMTRNVFNKMLANKPQRLDIAVVDAINNVLVLQD
ncbi:MAG: hypothetical protein JOZ67_07320 [Gammaproteobacteria bacterium]|nr:hypothetical protein [Gammaproteobacteria bacterium]MBV9697006.1 hypothetical protein [Gammaproteobacteria bacterium]